MDGDARRTARGGGGMISMGASQSRRGSCKSHTLLHSLAPLTYGNMRGRRADDQENIRGTKHAQIATVYAMNYDSTFFDYVNSGAITSANRLLPKLQEHIHVRSVLDVGCGQGAWLSAWRDLGVENLLGLDGDYVDRGKLLVTESEFKATDLTNGFRLGQRFELVQSLEVAEHLPMSCAAGFIDSLVAHSDLCLFSAAPKGQGGDNHVNEQPYDYWRAHFARHGYQVFDFVRPLVASDGEVEPWYRFNVFLYASRARAVTLPVEVQKTYVSDDMRLNDLSPWSYQVRKRIVATLPTPLATKLAKLKERTVARRRRARATAR